MDLQDATNPELVTDEDTEKEVETAEASDEGEAEAPEGEEETPEDEEELDIDGNPLRVPKSIAEKIKAGMMMQADYTQKTQAIAEQRREYETQRQALEWEQQTRQALFQEEAQLYGIRERLSQFQNVNWQQLAHENPQQALAWQAEATQLRDYEQRLSQHVEGRKSELSSHREQETAIVMKRAMDNLTKPDPKYGWDGKFDGTRSKELTDFGLQMGFTMEELQNTSHPLMIKGLNLMRLGVKYLEGQRKAQQRPAAEPAAKVPTAKANAYPRDPGKMSMEQYAAARKAGRIK